jgi:hypothetical protein
MFLSRRGAIFVVIGALSSKLVGGQREEDRSGPYCWAGIDDGKDRYIPCGSKIVQGDWITLDLSGYAGLRILLDGRTQYVTKQDIFTALADSESHSKP